MDDLLRDELLQLRTDVQNLSAQTARLEALLTESVVDELKNIRKRQDRHSARIDKLEEERTKALTFKSTIFWFISLIVSTLVFAMAIIEFYLKVV